MWVFCLSVGSLKISGSWELWFAVLAVCSGKGLGCWVWEALGLGGLGLGLGCEGSGLYH